MRVLQCVFALVATIVWSTSANSQFSKGFSDSFNRSFESNQQRRHERKLQEQRLQHELELERQRNERNAENSSPKVRGTILRQSEDLFLFDEQELYVVTQGCHQTDQFSEAILDAENRIILFLGNAPIQCRVLSLLQ